MTSLPLRLAATLGALGLAFMAGLLAGKASINSETARFEPQIQDAVHRWPLKSHQNEESVRKSYRPGAMFIPTRNQGQGMLCIELRLRPGDLGGSPVYCYKDDFSKPDEKTKLIAEYSDVE